MWDPLSQLPPQGYMHVMNAPGNPMGNVPNTPGQGNPSLPPTPLPTSGPGSNPAGPGGGSGQHLPGGMRDPMNPLDPRNLRNLTRGMDANALAAFMQQFRTGYTASPLGWLEPAPQPAPPPPPAPIPNTWDIQPQPQRTPSALAPYTPDSLRNGPW